MKFFDNDDYNTLRGLTICMIAVTIVVAIIGYYSHLSDIHDEKMAQMGCNQTLVNGNRLWECGKDNQR